MNEFKNRVSSKLNHKILNVKNVERDDSGEIISMAVEVIRNDTENLTQEGTPLNAESLNEIIQNMINNEINTLLLTDEEKVQSDLNTLEISTTITNKLELPVSGHRKCSIVWEVLSGEGITINNNKATIEQKLTQQTAIIKATISSGSYSDFKEFEITILKRELTAKERVQSDMNTTFIPTDVISNFNLPTSGLKGSTITWLAAIIVDGPTLSGNSVIVERGESDTYISLSGKFQYGTYIETKRYDVRVVGTNCFTPKTFTSAIVQQKGSPKSKSFTIATDTLENLYISVINNNSNDLNVVVNNNGDTSVTVLVTETTALNSSSGSGSEIIEFSLNVYLDNTLLVGTIPCSINYYYSSETPED